jgi:hypothetical protein
LCKFKCTNFRILSPDRYIFTAGGCTPTELIVSYIRAGDNVDTLKILSGWNIGFWTGKDNFFWEVYFLIKDSLDLYQPELWIEPQQYSEWEQPIKVTFDSLLRFDYRRYYFKLYLFRDGIKVDSLSQFCIAKIGIGVEQTGDKPVLSDQLYSNYPNPFNQETIIKYSIKNYGPVQLLTYNSNGQLIEVLLNRISSPGIYNLKWETNEVSTGLYFILLKTANQIEVRKCLLIK